MSGLDDFPCVDPVEQKDANDSKGNNKNINPTKTVWNFNLALILFIKGMLWFSVILMFFFMF